MTVYSKTPARRIEAIIFDLDDTLVDTFTSLIIPLELEAVSAMVAAGMDESDAKRLSDLILRLRRDEPERIEEILRWHFPQVTEKMIEARRDVFLNASADQLAIDPAVKEMLRELSSNYDTYLVTTGTPEFQNSKVERLGLREMFKGVGILASGSEATKERWMASLIRNRYRPESVIVVGNRVDNEIEAGNVLGMITVWVKYGEGSGMSPDEKTGPPDYIISNITEFPEVLVRLESARA
jgi:FMN phosphatase YigB (HAD superfamily)